jgi:hypothetical protein
LKVFRIIKSKVFGSGFFENLQNNKNLGFLIFDKCQSIGSFHGRTSKELAVKVGSLTRFFEFLKTQFRVKTCFMVFEKQR